MPSLGQASRISVLFLFCLSIAKLEPTCDEQDVIINVNTNVISNECVYSNNQTITCPNIQSALEKSECFGSSCSLIIYIPPGEHIISYPVSIDSSIKIIGQNKNETSIRCGFTRSDLPNDTLHTIYFNKSSYVNLTNFSGIGCPLPFRLDTVLNVHVDSISISYFMEAALEIYNSETVSIINSHFSDNTGSGIILRPFRGNTGSVAITYFVSSRSNKNPDIKVVNTTFFNNSVFARRTYRYSSRTFFRGLLTGRAGGLGVFIYEIYHNVTIHVDGCTFQDNYAQSYGGGLYFVYSGRNSQYTGTVSNCEFIRNTGGLGAGGFVTAVQSSGLVDAPHILNIRDCLFKSNRGNYGGGLYFFVLFQGGRGNRLSLTGCIFIDNAGINPKNEVGSALSASIYEIFEEKESYPVHSIKDCTFINNTGSNGIVSLGYLPFNLTGTNQFIRNTGSALRVIGSRLTVGGELRFINNTAYDGGALYLLSFAQIRLVRETKLFFQGNSGRYGASIVLDAINQSPVFSHIYRNPQCPLLLYPSQNIPPSMWDQAGINITFTGNTAWFGSAIYISSITACSWTGNTQPYFNRSYFPQWPIFFIRDDNVNTGFTDSRNQDNSIVTSAETISVSSVQIEGWPGENITTTMIAQDQLGKPCGSLTRVAFSPNISNEVVPEYEETEGVHISPDTFLITHEPYVTYISYSIVNERSNNGKTQLGNILVEEISFAAQETSGSLQSVPLVGIECPGGYQLQSVESLPTHQTCYCERNQREVILCEEDQESVIIETGQWAVRVKGKHPNLYFYTCPPGYCQCFFNTSIGPTACVHVYSNTQPDRQCACDRKGVLCGECPVDKGVSILFNTCTSCSDKYLFLIPVLVLVEIVVVMIILLIDKPLPSYIYPILFYIQNAPLAVLYFPQHFSLGGKYLYYIYSFLSLYFPYDFCVGKKTSAVVSFGLRFLPFVVSMAVITLTTIINTCTTGRMCRKYSIRGLKLHGVWTVILLTYTHTVYTVMSILNCPRIPTGNGIQNYWYINGSIECFTGEHIPLGLAAILVLLLCVLIIPSVSILVYKIPSKLSQLLPDLNVSFLYGSSNFKYPLWFSKWLLKLSASMKESFNSKESLWCGIELARRLIIVFFIVTFPGNALLLILLLSVFIGFYGYFKPYKNKWTNYIELITLVSFFLLLTLRTNPDLQDALIKYKRNTTFNVTDGFNEYCNHETFFVTDFSKLLIAWYYLPVVLTTFITVSYCVYLMLSRLRITRKSRKMMKNHQVTAKFDGESNLLTDYTMYETKPLDITKTTYLEIDNDNVFLSNSL